MQPTDCPERTEGAQAASKRRERAEPQRGRKRTTMVFPQPRSSRRQSTHPPTESTQKTPNKVHYYQPGSPENSTPPKNNNSTSPKPPIETSNETRRKATTHPTR